MTRRTGGKVPNGGDITGIQPPMNDPVQAALNKALNAAAQIADCTPGVVYGSEQSMGYYARQDALKLAIGQYARAKQVRNALRDVEREFHHAREKHRRMNSAHEGYGVILEELDELWDEIKMKVPDKAKMRAEAIQVAAMALAFVVEVCECD